MCLACLYCTGTLDKPGEPGEERTFATLLRDYTAYRAANSPIKRQMEFNNVTLPCLLFPPDPTASVLSFIPPPQLHLMMGATNHPFNLLRSIMATNNRLQQFDKWCSKNSITRRGGNIIF